MKKMNNKGFSLVELIIVIAIMAILAGALAPALISYVAKSRRSSDVNNAQSIASAIQAAISDEAAMDCLETDAAYASVAGTPMLLSNVDDTDDFGKVLDANLQGGLKAFGKLKATKTSKNASDAAIANKKIKSTDGFYISVDAASSGIKIYVKLDGSNVGTAALAADGTTSVATDLMEVYPTTNDAMTK